MIPAQSRHWKTSNSSQTQTGFTLQEVLIAMGIVLLLLGFSAPFIINYRGKSGVNRALEITKVILDRASEEARTVGYPLPDTMKQSGLTVTATEPNSDNELLIRLKKRLSSDTEAQVLTQKALRVGEARFDTMGQLDLAADTTTNGLFVEFVTRSPDGTEVLVGTIPVDVNGEFVLLGNAGNARITYSYGNYSRSMTVTVRGTSRLDRRT